MLLKIQQSRKAIIFLVLTGAVIVASVVTTTGLFAGSHAVYINKTDTAEFCIKCHPDKVKVVDFSAHSNAGCICHGYAPNATALYNINTAHNLTKNIYCTNCHSDYDDTGNITVHRQGSVNVSGINQSAHYITNNTSTLYKHAKKFLNS